MLLSICYEEIEYCAYVCRLLDLSWVSRSCTCNHFVLAMLVLTGSAQHNTRSFTVINIGRLCDIVIICSTGSRIGPNAFLFRFVCMSSLWPILNAWWSTKNLTVVCGLYKCRMMASEGSKLPLSGLQKRHDVYASCLFLLIRAAFDACVFRLPFAHYNFSCHSNAWNPKPYDVNDDNDRVKWFRNYTVKGSFSLLENRHVNGEAVCFFFLQKSIQNAFIIFIMLFTTYSIKFSLNIVLTIGDNYYYVFQR